MNLGINDGANGFSNAQTTTNLQAIIDAARLSGDVLLATPHPINPANVPDANQSARNAAIVSLAAAQGVPCIDLRAYFGSYAAISSRMPDGVHPSAEMAAEIGSVYRQCIQAMATA